MQLLDHMIDTMKEWELKMGKIDSDIRLYYPPDTIREFFSLSESTSEEELILIVKQYIQTEAAYLGDVKVIPAKDHRIGIAIPKEGSDYVAEHFAMPEFLQDLLNVLRFQDLDKIKKYFEEYAELHGGKVCEEAEEDGMGTVLFFDKEEIDPYVYCFDSDAFGVTYHRFSQSDYKKLR